MSNTQLEKWEHRADLDAKKQLIQANHRNETSIVVRVRCPRCDGAGRTVSHGPINRLECCPVCKGVGMAAFDWVRSNTPRALRADERRTEERERAEKVLSSVAG
jgi:DnaJ-class molecular chaperone